MSDDLDRLFGAHQRNMRASMEEAQQQRDAKHPENRRVARYEQRREAREQLEAQAGQDERQAEQSR